MSMMENTKSSTNTEPKQAEANTKTETKTKTKTEARVAGNWIQSYLKCTEGQESPTLFHLWVAITTIAAALRRNVHIRMGHFKIYPNFYTVLISPSGTCRKSTAIGIGEGFLRHVEGINIFRTKMTPEALLTFLKEEAQIVSETDGDEEGTGVSDAQKHDTRGQARNNEEDETQDEQVAVSGGEEEENEAYSTEETEADYPSENTGEEAIEAPEPSKEKLEFIESTSGFIIASELATMLGSASYSDDLKFLLTDLYDNKVSDGYTTKNSGRIKLHNVNINLLAGSTPTWMARNFSEDAFGGGFMGRTIFVYQEEGTRIPWPEKSEELEVLEQMLIVDLQHISRLQGNFFVTTGAKDFYSDWYMNRKLEAGTRMSGYFERKHIHLLKIAMILAIAESDTKVIDVRHCKAALVLLEQVEDWMPDAFAYIGATVEAQVEQQILEFLRSRGGYATASVLLKHIRKSIKGKRDFDTIMDTLRASGTVISQIKDHNLYYIFTEEYQKHREAKRKAKDDRLAWEEKQKQEREARQKTKEKE